VASVKLACNRPGSRRTLGGNSATTVAKPRFTGTHRGFLLRDHLDAVPSGATSGPGNVADRVEVGAQRLHAFSAEGRGDPVLELRHEILGDGDDRAPLLGG
jgi:hypothetical protein